jgi:hypothetical protein
VTRVVSAVPAFGRHNPGDQVAISVDVEVQIDGTITGRVISPPSRSEAWYQPASVMPGMDSTVYDVELPPANLWKSLGTDTIEVEAQATFGGDTYTDFCFIAARLKPMPLTSPQ